MNVLSLSKFLIKTPFPQVCAMIWGELECLVSYTDYHIQEILQLCFCYLTKWIFFLNADLYVRFMCFDEEHSVDEKRQQNYNSWLHTANWRGSKAIKEIHNPYLLSDKIIHHDSGHLKTWRIFHEAVWSTKVDIGDRIIWHVYFLLIFFRGRWCWTTGNTESRLFSGTFGQHIPLPMSHVKTLRSREGSSVCSLTRFEKSLTHS